MKFEVEVSTQIEVMIYAKALHDAAAQVRAGIERAKVAPDVNTPVAPAPAVAAEAAATAPAVAPAPAEAPKTRGKRAVAPKTATVVGAIAPTEKTAAEMLADMKAVETTTAPAVVGEIPSDTALGVAIKKLGKDVGFAEAKDVLTQFGVTRSQDVKPERRVEFMNVINTKLGGKK